MHSPEVPPPVPPPVPGVGGVLLMCLVPAATLLIAALLGYNPTRTVPVPVTVLLAVSFLAPAWAAWDLHRRRRAIGKNMLPNAWIAAGAGALAGVLFCMAACILAVVVFVLVMFGVCVLNGGRLGG